MFQKSQVVLKHDQKSGALFPPPGRYVVGHARACQSVHGRDVGTVLVDSVLCRVWLTELTAKQEVN